MSNRKKASANGSDVDDSTLPVLTLASVQKAYESIEPRFARVDILGDGNLSLIYYRPPTTGETIKLSESKPNSQMSATVEYVARITCNPDGSPLFTEDDLHKLPNDMVNNIALAIIRARSSEGGKGKNA